MRRWSRASRAKQLNEYLRDTGLFFPVDPGADASLGGMAATRASGTNAVRYGTMRDAVLGLTAVLADGRIVTTGGGRARSSAGYDLTRLLVGSEGTLGVITELTLKLFGIPETILAGVCTFDTLEGRLQRHHRGAADGIAAGPHRAARRGADPRLQCLFAAHPARDRRPCSWSSTAPRPARASRSRAFAEIARAEGRRRAATGPTARRTATGSGRRATMPIGPRADLRPGADLIATDVCVPISALADCVTETKQDIERLGLLAPIVGHVGDGNFHVMPLIDPADRGRAGRVRSFWTAWSSGRCASRGTCTGEHGVGQGKIGYLARRAWCKGSR